ncbi:MAG: histidine kinase, partial [Pseudomonadota bacterium]|nr:histidine kinase [Pseudomonadota bacterium]
MKSGTRLRYCLAYGAFWLGVGLFFSLAEWQHYVRNGGLHPWEPFLWEISGSLTTGVLAAAVYQWNEWLLAPGRGRAAVIAGHLAGVVVFVLVHPALMFSMRFAAYALVGVDYRPGDLASVLGYESAKDAVSYTLVLGLAMGWRAFRRGQRQAAEVERLNAHLAEARLARLQEQIQPHFLFNTLNLISSVMHEDVERADRILAELADLLRQSMSAARVAEHSVAHEMRWVEPFLSIMQQRFGERLRARLEISDAAARCRVPALLLMAPVENAVKHGVSRSTAAVEIAVLAT